MHLPQPTPVGSNRNLPTFLNFMIFEVGQLVKFNLKGVTNDRIYKTVGKIISLHGTIAVLRYSRPWGRYMEQRPVMLRDLKPFKPRNPATYDYF